MPLFNSQIHWPGIGAMVAGVLLTLFATAFALVSYVEWSSNAAVAEFMSATASSASDPNHSNEFSSSNLVPQGPNGLPPG